MGACKSEPIRLPELSGHRGADCIAPENTLASADSCIKYKIDFMECDICISKDSVFYLLHDSTLDRTTNGTGLIREWLSGRHRYIGCRFMVWRKVQRTVCSPVGRFIAEG